jgi:hypothetical protein
LNIENHGISTILIAYPNRSRNSKDRQYNVQKRKKGKQRETTDNKILHRKLKIEQHELHKKWALEGYAISIVEIP